MVSTFWMFPFVFVNLLKIYIRNPDLAIGLRQSCGLSEISPN